jgi:hypothetical protein
MQARFNELDVRIRLGKVKMKVVEAIDRLDRQAKLAGCLSAVRTKPISDKATELTEKVVSPELQDALNDEFRHLGVARLRVVLKSRTDKGKAFHRLKLDLPQAKTPAEILSEGEQRAIALGSFLAELKVAGGESGVIFDDPVSSLDHKRRECVARRLVQEAARRQVIVLTHDLYFLSLIVEEAKKANLPVEKQSLTRRPQGFGVADPGFPFEGMNTKARVHYLRSKQPQIKKLYDIGDEPEHRMRTANVYRELRLAWERAIEEVLLNCVVLRFRKGVETQRLAGVQVEDDDYATVDKWITKCSNYSHDQALLGGVEVPDPDGLLADIDALENWRAVTCERGEKLQKKRKSGKRPATTQ